MSFNVGDTTTNAVERLTTSAAAVLIAGLTVVGVVQTAAVQDIARGFLEWMLEMVNEPEVREELTASELETFEEQVNASLAELPLALGLSPGLAMLLWLGAFVIALAIVAIALETFAHERDSLDELTTEGIGSKTVHLLLGWIAFGILFVIGLVLFVLPGLLVAFLFVFFAAAIVIDGDSFYKAFGSSYAVVRANLIGTLAIVVLSIGVVVAILIVQTIFRGFLPGVPAEIVANLLSAVGQVFVLALLASAYVEATGDEPSMAEAPVDETADWGAE